jgi:hypothetical protein
MPMGGRFRPFRTVGVPGFPGILVAQSAPQRTTTKGGKNENRNYEKQAFPLGDDCSDD